MNETFVVKNFYTDPHSIIEKYAICDQPSPCPGSRSKHLVDVDSQFYKDFRTAIFKIHNIPDIPELYLSTYFNLITPFEEEILNYNWPHIDGDVRYGDTTLNHENYSSKMILGGQIILSDIVDDQMAMRFWKDKPELKWSKEQLFDKVLFNYITSRDEFESGKITMEEYKKRFEEFHQCFILDKAIPNSFNEMVSWKAGAIRGGIMVSKTQGSKLSQNFYIHTRVVK